MLNITGLLNQALERIVQLEQKVEVNGTKSHTKKSPLEGKGGFYHMTQIMPDKLSRVADFKEWSEDYREYVAAQSEALAEMLDTARDSKERITRMGDDGDTVEFAKALYKSLKKRTWSTRRAERWSSPSPTRIPSRPGVRCTPSLIRELALPRRPSSMRSWTRTNGNA